MTKKHSSFIIAAPKSNSGKTIVTLGLIHALKKRGLRVQPFKCGPDYIDTMHHGIVAGQPSYNLDPWMAKEEHVSKIFLEQSANSDVSVIEGAMGLFDGAKKDEGSAASIACLLNVQVVLVVDASGVAYSIAPLLYGFKSFDRQIRIAGVIFNKVAGENHYRSLKEAAEDAGVKSLGYLPRDEGLAIESRHLGLHLPGEQKNIEIIECASHLIEKNIEIDQLLHASRYTISIQHIPEKTGQKDLTIAMAYDEAFNFTYQANLDILNQLGAIKYFSPLKDKSVPDADLIWLPGGYPELFAEQLSKNVSMLESIRGAIEKNISLAAECGGMMYLGSAIETVDGDLYQMARVFDFQTSFVDMKLHLGYREVELGESSFRGHEFHYSEMNNSDKSMLSLPVKTARDKDIDMPVFKYKNCWASYMHLYLGEKEKMITFISGLGL
jgi:cobyrinic acid a,c-diamide synthase